jgi:hypothetical protein
MIPAQPPQKTWAYRHVLWFVGAAAIGVALWALPSPWNAVGPAIAGISLFSFLFLAGPDLVWRGVPE